MINEPDFSDIPERTPQTPADAAGWVVRLHSDQTVQTDAVEFETWKGTGPANESEFKVHQDIWRAIGSLADNAEARAVLVRRAKRRSWERRALFGALALGAMAAAIAVIVRPGTAIGSQTYQTARGERRNVLLEDGSAIILNTDSTLRVSLDKKERRVVLERGEFFVQVAKDTQRPFRVFVAEHEVRALGTAFDVYRDDTDKKTQVTLEQGVVAIYENGARDKAKSIDEPSVVLRPGQRATLRPMSPPMVTILDARIANAWREGIINFDDTPLGEAVKDVNRYYGRQIVIADPKVADLKISGSFHIDALDHFVDSLAAAFPIRVEHEDATTTVITSS